MDFSDFHDALTALLEAVRHTLRTELTSVWLPIQLGLIGLAAVIAAAISVSVRKRVDFVSLTMGWPLLLLRMFVRALVTHMGAIAFIVVLFAVRTGLRADLINPRTYRRRHCECEERRAAGALGRARQAGCKDRQARSVTRDLRTRARGRTQSSCG